MPQFLDPSRTRDGAITKRADHRGYIVVRRDPHGFWEVSYRLDDKELADHYKRRFFTTLQKVCDFIDEMEGATNAPVAS